MVATERLYSRGEAPSDLCFRQVTGGNRWRMGWMVKGQQRGVKNITERHQLSQQFS